MTEREKAAAGLLYDANYDPELIQARAIAKDLCMDYNQLRSAQKKERLALLRTLLAVCDEDTYIEPPFFVDYGSNIRVGKAFYANHNLVILDGAPVTFGDHVFIVQTAAFPQPDTRSTSSSEMPVWNMPSRSRSATMCGLAWAYR